MAEVGVRELKTRSSEIIRDVREQRTRYVITHRGRPVGLLIPLEKGGAVALPASGDLMPTAWDDDLAREFAATLSRLPHLVWVPLDTTLAQQAADVAVRYRLRGSDAVYAAVALRFGSTLVTLDREQRERVAEALPTRYPAEAAVLSRALYG